MRAIIIILLYIRRWRERENNASEIRNAAFPSVVVCRAFKRGSYNEMNGRPTSKGGRNRAFCTPTWICMRVHRAVVSCGTQKAAVRVRLFRETTTALRAVSTDIVPRPERSAATSNVAAPRRLPVRSTKGPAYARNEKTGSFFPFPRVTSRRRIPLAHPRVVAEPRSR